MANVQNRQTIHEWGEKKGLGARPTSENQTQRFLEELPSQFKMTNNLWSWFLANRVLIYLRKQIASFMEFHVSLSLSTGL